MEGWSESYAEKRRVLLGTKISKPRIMSKVSFSFETNEGLDVDMRY